MIIYTFHITWAEYFLSGRSGRHRSPDHSRPNWVWYKINLEPARGNDPLAVIWILHILLFLLCDVYTILCPNTVTSLHSFYEHDPRCCRARSLFHHGYDRTVC